MSTTGKLLKHSTIYAIGNISRQLIGFIMLPVYTRYLTPADYGVIGLLTFAISLIEGVFGARLGQAMPKFYFEQSTETGRQTVISTAILLTGVTSAIVTLILFLSRDASSSLLFGTSSYSAIAGLFSVSILNNALESQCLVYLQIKKLPLLFVSINLAKLALQFVLNILLVVHFELGVTGIALTSVTSTGIFAIGLSVYCLRQTGIGFDKNIAKKMVLFSWPLWLAGIASLYLSSAGRYYIRIFSSLSDVGLYELGAKFGAILTLLVAQPFSRYWDTERFNHYQKQNSADIFRSVFQIYGTILALTVLGVDLFSKPIIRIMAAAEFHSAYIAVPFITLSAFFRCLTDYCNFSFLVTEKTAWLSRNQYATAIVVTLLYLILIPVLGFTGAAVALALSEMFQFFLVHKEAKKLFDMQIDLRPVATILSIVAIAYIVALVTPQGSLIADLLGRTVILLLSGGLICVYFWRTIGTKSAAINSAVNLIQARWRKS